MNNSNKQSEGSLSGIEIEGMTRSSFILSGALAAGTVYGASAVSPFVGAALGKDSPDIEILNFALTLEYLEADFYDKGLAGSGLRGEVRKLAQEFGDAEQQHVDALRGTIEKLGGKPVKSPTFTFDIPDEKSFLALAVTLEDTGVSAYNGAGPSIKSKEVLAAAGGIVQVEARHAAAVRGQVDEAPAPDSFDKPLGEAAVLKAVKPLIAS